MKQLLWLTCISAMLLACNLMGGANSEEGTVPKIIRDTVIIHDTIYQSPPIPGTPKILGAEVYQSNGTDGNSHNFVDVDWENVKASIGYKVYVSTVKDNENYELPVTAGNLVIRDLISSLEGVGYPNYKAQAIFFRVAAVNADGVEGKKSASFALFYQGY